MNTEKRLALILLIIIIASCALAWSVEAIPFAGEKEWATTLEYFSCNDPIVVDDLVYVTSDKSLNGGSVATIHCISSVSGEIIWNFTRQWPQFTVNNGCIYVGHCGMNSKSVRATSCLDAYTGAEIWNTTYGYLLGSKAVQGDVLYVGGSIEDNGVIYALNASNGEKLWRFNGPRGVAFGIFYKQGEFIATDDYICTVGSDGLYVLNSKNGTLNWKYSTDNPQTINYANGKVYLSSFYENSDRRQGEISVFDINTGEKLWNYNTKDFFLWQNDRHYWLIPNSPPVLGNDLMYVLTQDGEINALNVSDGRTVWKYQLNKALWMDEYATIPVIVGDKLLVSSPIGIYCFNKDKGIFIWQYTENEAGVDPIRSYFAVDNGIVYVGFNAPSNGNDDEQHTFCALDESNGRVLWKYTVNRNMLSVPVVANGTVYFGGDSISRRTFHITNGMLFALKAMPTEKYEKHWLTVALTALIVVTSSVAVLLVLKKNRRLTDSRINPSVF